MYGLSGLPGMADQMGLIFHMPRAGEGFLGVCTRFHGPETVSPPRKVSDVRGRSAGVADVHATLAAFLMSVLGLMALFISRVQWALHSRAFWVHMQG